MRLPLTVAVLILDIRGRYDEVMKAEGLFEVSSQK